RYRPRSPTVDSSAVPILLTSESSRKGVPWKVRRRTASRLSQATAETRWPDPASHSTEGLQFIPAHLVSTRLDRGREAGIRRAGARCPLPRTLHAPYRDL